MFIGGSSAMRLLQPDSVAALGIPVRPETLISALKMGLDTGGRVLRYGHGGCFRWGGGVIFIFRRAST
jgi:hypothetical protein